MSLCLEPIRTDRLQVTTFTFRDFMLHYLVILLFDSLAGTHGLAFVQSGPSVYDQLPLMGWKDGWLARLVCLVCI